MVWDKFIRLMNKTEGVPLRFVPLDFDTVYLVLVSDATLANDRDLKIPSGIHYLLTGRSRQRKCFHYSSNRCTRAARSFLTTEVH